jgi:hypothetical protein
LALFELLVTDWIKSAIPKRAKEKRLKNMKRIPELNLSKI